MDKDSFYQFFNDGVVRVALIGVLSILALFLLAETIAVASNVGRPGAPATDTITVQGTGQATMPPDVARLSFSVENTAAAVSDAQAKTTEQTNKVLDFVKEQGVEDKDVRTLSYNISPQYSYPASCLDGYCPPPRTPKVTGYQVSQTVQVTVRDLAKVGELLSGLGDLEVQNVSGPAFALDDETAGYAAARADAIVKAKAQAELLEEQLGVKLGKIVNFSESSGGFPYPLYYGLGGDAFESKAAPSVPPGENTYSASVSITYEIR